MTDKEETKVDRTWLPKTEQKSTSVAPKFSITGILLPAANNPKTTNDYSEQMYLGLQKP